MQIDHKKVTSGFDESLVSGSVEGIIQQIFMGINFDKFGFVGNQGLFIEN